MPQSQLTWHSTNGQTQLGCKCQRQTCIWFEVLKGDKQALANHLLVGNWCSASACQFPAGVMETHWLIHTFQPRHHGPARICGSISHCITRCTVGNMEYAQRVLIAEVFALWRLLSSFHPPQESRYNFIIKNSFASNWLSFICSSTCTVSTHTVPLPINCLITEAWKFICDPTKGAEDVRVAKWWLVQRVGGGRSNKRWTFRALEYLIWLVNDTQEIRAVNYRNKRHTITDRIPWGLSLAALKMTKANL